MTRPGTNKVALQAEGLVREYHANLWRVYLKTKKFLHAKVLSSEDEKILARIVYETKRLCGLIYKQYQSGIETGTWSQFPVDYTEQQNPERMVFRLDSYPHMHPQIKRFMDASAVEYKRIVDANPPSKGTCAIM